MATKIAIKTVNATADHIKIARRPKRSITHGSGYVPSAKIVFITAARS